MKKILFPVAIACMFTACNSNKDKDETTKNLVPLSDTSAAYRNSVMSDTPKTVQAPAAPETVFIAKPTPKKSVKQTTVASHSNTVKPAPATTTTTTTSTTSTANTTPAASVPAPAPAPEKKGWSSAAKGTAIGAGAGAVTGAIIGKNVKGAVIGGAVGAAGGYIIGRQNDKKTGRVKKDTL